MALFFSMNENISIIIPVKNEEKRLPSCLSAIRNLNYSQELLEIIIVDNGSTDNTLGVARDFKCQIMTAPHATIAKLRNIGAYQSKGSIICFVDADIIVEANWLMAAIKHFKNNKVGCVTGMINIPHQSVWIERIWSLNRKTRRDIFVTRWASSMNMILPRKTFLLANGFSEGLITGEDVNLSERITAKGMQIVYDSKVQVTHVGEAKSIKQFFNKERWRGFSDLDLLFSRPLKVGNLKNAVQPLFFIASFVVFIVAIFFGGFKLSMASLLVFLSLPLSRTALVVAKQRNLKYCSSLAVVWFFYYIARSVAIMDNLADKGMRLCRGTWKR